MLANLFEALVIFLYHIKQILWDLIGLLSGSLPEVLNQTNVLLVAVVKLLIDLEYILEKIITMFGPGG